MKTEGRVGAGGRRPRGQWGKSKTDEPGGITAW